MANRINSHVARLDRRNQGAPWRGPTCPTYPTIKEGGEYLPSLGTPGAPGRPLRDFSELAGLVGQVGHCLENQRVTASNRICC